LKKLVNIVSYLLLGSLLLIACLFYVSYHGNEIDESARGFVVGKVPPILKTWSGAVFLQQASPQVVDMLSKNPDQLKTLFDKFSTLGELQSFSDVKGNHAVNYSFTGMLVTARYTGQAKFKNGAAVVKIALVELDGEWKISDFYIESPYFQRQNAADSAYLPAQPKPFGSS